MDTHVGINKEVEITLKLKVKIDQISFYHPLSEEEIKIETDKFIKELPKIFVWELSKESYKDSVNDVYPYFNYEVERD